MGFLDDVATNIKSAAGAIGEKAGNIYDRSRHSYTASGIKSDIKDKFTAFGKAVYEKVKDGKFNIEDFSDEIEAIDMLYIQLDSVNELIAKSKNLKICGSCGKTVSVDAEYCEHCGKKII